MNFISRIPALVAATVAMAPALAWAWFARPQVFTWFGLARLTGLAAAGLFAVSMLLMLRLTWLDRIFRGLGHVYQAHHVLGMAALIFMLLHPFGLALAFMAAQWRPEALRFLVPDPSSPVVFSGWVALFLFVVFFVVTMAPRLPFHLWRRLHRVSGLAYAAMVWHLVAAWSGSMAAGFAFGLVIAGAAGFAHRLLVEDSPRRGLRYRVIKVEHRSPKVVDLVLEPLGARLRFDAGQFVYLAMLDAPDYHACGELHPYTLTGHPDDPQLHLSIKALGRCTRHIQECHSGRRGNRQGAFRRLVSDASAASSAGVDWWWHWHNAFFEPRERGWSRRSVH